MLFPELVEDLQQQTFLDHAHNIGAVVGCLLRHFPIGDVEQPGADFLVGDTFFRRPIDERQV